MKSNSRRRWIASIAIAAILINSFAPSVTQALAGLRGEISLAFGASVFDDTTVTCGQSGRSPAPDSHQSSSSHCPYCAPHGSSFAVPPQRLSGAVASAGPDLLLVFYVPAAPRLSAWAVAQARAPPPYS